MFSFASRLESSMRGWPQAMKCDFRAYIRRFQCDSGGRSMHPGHTLPYWLLLPAWLTSAYNDARPTTKTITGRTLNDVLWGQYCVFLSVRIQDDLFDRQTSFASLLFAGDQFLADACDVLFRHAGHSDRFRKIFIASLKETLRSIMEVDAMQRRTRVSLKALRTGHARVSSIFKIGSAAVCCLAERWRDFPKIAAACDELAVAGQTIDDFQDIDEDFRDKRLNYAARFLLGTSNPAAVGTKDTLHRIAERLLFSNRTDRLFTEIISHIQAAHEALAPLGLKETERYFDEYTRSLKRTASAVGRERVRRIFNDDRGRLKNTSGTT